MRVVNEETVQRALDIPAASKPASAGRLVAPYPGVEQTSSPDIPGAWRIGRKMLFILLTGAAFWVGAAWLIAQAF